VFWWAIHDNAAALIIAHNHPSGQTEPSAEDREITVTMKDAGRILGIEVLDHIVVAKAGYYSFLERGTL
jgi:DNA repair protein RadC